MKDNADFYMNGLTIMYGLNGTRRERHEERKDIELSTNPDSLCILSMIGSKKLDSELIIHVI